MPEPFLGEIRMVGFPFAPRGWALCDGQLMPIEQNQALFSLLGTTYGGDGRTTFALPDLRGRTPVNVGEGVAPGQKGGQESVILGTSQIPQHTHTLNAIQGAGNQPVVDDALLASSGSDVYGAATNLTQMNSGAVLNTGASQGHQNMQPFLVINFVIAIQGLLPSRN